MRISSALLAGSIALTGIAPSFAVADVRFAPERIVPVTFDREINVTNAHAGDRFTASVVDELDLPRGTRFEGEVVDVKPRKGSHPAFVDMEFTAVILPDGPRTEIHAVPVRLDSRYVKQDRDGHFIVDKKAMRKENVVLGGAVGGFILGALIKKPFEGTFIGILAGIVINEAGAQDEGVAVSKGERLGVLFEREVVIRTDGPYRGEHANDQDRNADRAGDAAPPARNDGPPNNDSARPPREERDPRIIRIALGDYPIEFDKDQMPYREGNVVMVPLESAAKYFGVEVEKGSGGRIYLETDDNMLRLERDSRDYRLNGKRGQIGQAPVEKQGVVYVPLEVFAPLKPEGIYLNGVKVEFSS
jgi:hypothetical protein